MNLEPELSVVVDMLKGCSERVHLRLQIYTPLAQAKTHNRDEDKCSSNDKVCVHPVSNVASGGTE